MRCAVVFAVVLCAASRPCVAGEAIKAEFLGAGTYATAEGCEKLAKIAAGGPRNVETAPEVLTEDGFAGWEGSCTFHSITETDKGRAWKANMKCFEGAAEDVESDLFEKLPDGKFKVTVMGTSTVFQRCDGAEGK